MANFRPAYDWFAESPTQVQVQTWLLEVDDGKTTGNLSN